MPAVLRYSCPCGSGFVVSPSADAALASGAERTAARLGLAHVVDRRAFVCPSCRRLHVRPSVPAVAGPTGTIVLN